MTGPSASAKSACAAATRLGEQWARGTALWTRGAARWLSGDNAAAIGDVLACLRIKERLGDLHTIAMSFDLLSVCLVATGDVERAAVLHGASEKLWTLLNAPVLMGPAYTEIRKSGADTARNALGEERFDALVGHGYAMPLHVALAVAKGEAPAAPTAGHARTAEPGAGAKALTRREREIAELVADGLGNRDIAERLFLSKRTVDSHVEHIFSQAGVLLPRPAHRLGARTQGIQLIPLSAHSLTCTVIRPSQYSSRSGGATFPAVTSRLPSDGKVSACQMTRGPACPGGR